MKSAWVIACCLFAGGLLAYAMTRAFPSDLSLELFAARDTVRIRDTVRLTIRDTLRIYIPKAAKAKAESDSLDAKVVIVDDSTVSLPDTIGQQRDYSLPPLVVADIRALRVTVATQDTLLRWFHRKSAADSLAIVARDRLIALHRPPKCSRKCGILIGAVSVAGLVYLVK